MRLLVKRFLFCSSRRVSIPACFNAARDEQPPERPMPLTHEIKAIFETGSSNTFATPCLLCAVAKNASMAWRGEPPDLLSHLSHLLPQQPQPPDLLSHLSHLLPQLPKPPELLSHLSHLLHELLQPPELLSHLSHLMPELPELSLKLWLYLSQ